MKTRLLLTLMALMLLPIIGNLIGWNAYAYLKIGSRDLIWGASHGVSHVAITKHDRPDPELFMGMDMLADTQDEKAGIIALKVSAFEKEYALTRDRLADISGAQWNGMRVIYDGGILGETIWIRVEVATSTGTRDEALIRVSNDGSIQAGIIPRKAL